MSTRQNETNARFLVLMGVVVAVVLMAFAFIGLVGASEAQAKSQKAAFVMTQAKLNGSYATLKQKPATIVAIGYDIFSNLSWSQWGGRKAVATGNAQYNKGRVTIEMSSLEQCGPYRIYTVLRITEREGLGTPPSKNARRIYRCLIGMPENVMTGTSAVRPWTVTLTKRLSFDTGRWKGWGSPRTVGIGDIIGDDARSRVIGRNIGPCRGILTYRVITAKWAGKSRTVRLGRNRC